MIAMRRLFAERRWIAVMLLMAALAVRLLVPAGYMPARPGDLTLTICSGHMPATITVPGVLPPDAPHHPAERDGADQPCPFAGVAMPTLPEASVPAIAPILAAAAPAPAGRRAAARAPPGPAFLRPPLRGPPSLG